MRDYRIESYHNFVNIPNPNWGPDLSFIDFQAFTYIKSTDKAMNSWDDVPEKIKGNI